MDGEARRYINQIAERVIKAYDIDIPIENIEQVVRNIGGTIEKRENIEIFCDGTIRKTGDRSFCIAISNSFNVERSRFTIAHELGHLFLHMGFRTNHELWSRQDSAVYMRFGSSEQEYQANEFAAAFLMPENEFAEAVEELREGNSINTQILANYFNVSKQAASNRGKFLGYFEW